jgi:hypothetical protein
MFYRSVPAVLGLLLLCSGSASAQLSESNIGLLFEAVGNRGLDLKRDLKVEGAHLKRGHLDLYLDSGEFYPAELVGGQVLGGVFIGEGRISYQVVEPVDRWLLNDRLGVEQLEEVAFDTAFLQFDDGSFSELFPDLLQVSDVSDTQVTTDTRTTARARGRVVYAEEEVTVTAKLEREERKADRYWKQRRRNFNAVRYLVDLLNLDLDMTRNLIEGHGGVFSVEVRQTDNSIAGSRWLSYVLNPRWAEEQVLFKHWPYPVDPEQQEVILFASQHMPDEYERLDRRQRAYENPSLIDVEHADYRFEVLNQGGDGHALSGWAQVRIRAREATRTAYFRLVGGANARGDLDALTFGPEGYDPRSEPDSEVAAEGVDVLDPDEGVGDDETAVPDPAVATGFGTDATEQDFYDQRPGVRRPSYDSIRPEYESSETRGVLNYNFGVDLSVVKTPEEVAVPFVHDHSQVLLALPVELQAGERLNLVFKWDGEVVDSVFQDIGNATANLYYLPDPASAAWYPNAIHGDQFTWTVELRHPRKMRAAVAGTHSDEVEDEDGLVRTQLAVPGTGPSMFLGQYLTTEGLAVDKRFDVRVFTHPRFKREAKGYIKELDGLLQVYEILFGPMPYTGIDLAQTGFGSFAFRGTAPGLIELGGSDFISKTEIQSSEATGSPAARNRNLARGVASQWWKHKFGYRTHRDWWLQEAFVEYAMALYIRKLLGASYYKSRVREWKFAGMSREPKGFVGSAGYLLEPDERVKAVYGRGPLILHALGEALGDEFFKTLNVWHQSAGVRTMTTEDLRVMLELITKKDWTWFFDEFIYNEGDMFHLIRDPESYINLENRPAAAHLGFRPPSDVERVLANHSFEGVVDGLIASAFGDGWTRQELSAIPNPKSTIQSLCRWSVPISLMQPAYSCKTVATYTEPGGLPRQFDCEALLRIGDKTVVERVPGSDSGAWCSLRGS